jgi:MOSC domain-containing protein YiiM
VTLHSKDRQEKWPRLLAHLAAEHGRDFGLLARVTAVGRVSAGQQVRIVTT